MSNPNKAKGTAWESAVRDHLNDSLGLYAEGWRDYWPGQSKFRNPADPLNVKRQAQEGIHDVGDLHAWPFVVECKDVKTPAVPAWLRQARTETANAGFRYGVVAHKTRNASVRRGRVHIDVRTFTRLRLVVGMTTRQFVAACGFTWSFRSLDTSRWYFSTDVDRLAYLVRFVRSVDYAE